MSDLLLELFSEEIPARMQRKAAEDLKKLVTDALVERGFLYEGAKAFATPRRLALHIAGLPVKGQDVTEEKKGPRTDAPAPAIQGFLKSAGLADVAQATIVEDPKKGAFYVARAVKPGRPTLEVLAEIIPQIIRAFPWPKSMRWGAQSLNPGALRWVRPLKSILCTFGPETEETEVVPFEIGGITSGRITYGHRMHHPEAITVRRFEDYVAKLEKARVILDAERRKDIIAHDARNLAFAQGFELIEDEGLLEEVAGLVEWPVVLMGGFEADFLTIPGEVIRATIRANQKCFVVKTPDGRLANRFLLVSNLVAADGGAKIIGGNERVVRARLSDARHFWETDRKPLPDVADYAKEAADFGLDLTKPLDQRMAKLAHLGVVFHKDLGTQGERVQRIIALARELAQVTGADPDLCARAAALAKADLPTEMVGEFPELQGLMGRYYAELQGEDASVAAAIEQHYKPLGPADSVPTDKVAVTVALADKLDTLVGFWAIDEKPTGSKDPYALRRAALGVIRLVLENGVRVELLKLPRPTFPKVGKIILQVVPSGVPIDPDLLAFFHDRLKVQLKEQGARHDLVDAVLGSGEANDDLVRIVERVKALTSFLATEDGANLLAGYKRAANILRAEEKKDGEGAYDAAPDKALLILPVEQELAAALDATAAAVKGAVAREDFAAAMTALSRLRAPVDAFFAEVMVNAEEAEIRMNRLRLLAQLRTATRAVADFGRIAG